MIIIIVFNFSDIQIDTIQYNFIARRIDLNIEFVLLFFQSTISSSILILEDQYRRFLGRDIVRVDWHQCRVDNVTGRSLLVNDESTLELIDSMQP